VAAKKGERRKYPSLFTVNIGGKARVTFLLAATSVLPGLVVNDPGTAQAPCEKAMRCIPGLHDGSNALGSFSKAGTGSGGFGMSLGRLPGDQTILVRTIILHDQRPSQSLALTSIREWSLPRYGGGSTDLSLYLARYRSLTSCVRLGLWGALRFESASCDCTSDRHGSCRGSGVRWVNQNGVVGRCVLPIRPDINQSIARAS